uniref:Spindle assembly abnormal protein 6 N-terminal domain-containing protein n=1 Tax=Gadus morhua TaxID=8049 RepID=A0A8C4ZNV7_GADMO
MCHAFRKANIRVNIDLLVTSNPVYKRDLVVRLTDDVDPYFLYSLSISEEDYQSLKVQQGLLIDFASFPQKFIDLLHLCLAEQEKESPRFLLHLACQSSLHDSAAHFSVVETNAFKHLNHLSLKLLQGSDKEVKDYLATCLSFLLSFQTTSLSSRHSQDLMSEREKALEIQGRLQQQTEQIRQELEGSHQRSSQQLQSRLAELEASTRELTERRYKNESALRDLMIKLASAEEESQRAKQQVTSLRRENGTLDTELHDKERSLGQLQTRLAVLEQEVKDKEQLMGRTREVLEATQQQKETMEGNVESKDHQIKKLESTVRSLSEEQKKANGIIKKLQADGRMLAEKIKVKNSVTVSQEKVVQDTAEKLHTARRLLQDAKQQLTHKDEQVSKLKEQLETTIEKLNESKEVLKTNENGKKLRVTMFF